MVQKKDSQSASNAQPSLSRKIVQGGLWIFLLRIGEKLLGLVRLIVVASLLTPNDFGLLGVAAIITSILNIFLESGFNQALIHEKEKIKGFLNTAWTIQVFRGLLIFIVIYIIAPYAAMFFNEPKAVNIIRVFAFTQVLDGFRNIGVIYFQKEMEFKKQFSCSFIPEAIALAATIWAAFVLRDVWALVIGALVCSVFIVIFSYVMHSYRPRFEINAQKLKSLWHFGKWVIGYSILGFLVIQGDDILVGKVLGAASLGLYQMAYRISNLPATQITHVIIQVTFPAYAKMQDNILRLREGYLRVLQMVAFVSFPVAGLIFILCPLFTEVFLGQKWIAMVPPMQVLCFFGLIRSLTATTGPVFVGVGKPKIMTQLSLIQLLLMVIIIYPLTKKWGIVGTAYAALIPNFVTPVLACRRLLKIIRCDLKQILKPILIPMSAALFMLVLAGALLRVSTYNNIFSFILVLIFSGVFYLIAVYLIGKRFGYKMMEMITGILQQFKRGEVS